MLKTPVEFIVRHEELLEKCKSWGVRASEGHRTSEERFCGMLALAQHEEKLEEVVRSVSDCGFVAWRKCVSVCT